MSTESKCRPSRNVRRLSRNVGRSSRNVMSAEISSQMKHIIPGSQSTADLQSCYMYIRENSRHCEKSKKGMHCANSHTHPIISFSSLLLISSYWKTLSSAAFSPSIIVAVQMDTSRYQMDQLTADSTAAWCAPTSPGPCSSVTRAASRRQSGSFTFTARNWRTTFHFAPDTNFWPRMSASSRYRCNVM